MDDADLVRGLQRLGDLAREGQGLVEGNGAAGDPLREMLALDQLHHQRARAAGLLQAEDLRDVRMIEGGQRLRLALEAHQAIGVRRERLGRHLQRHVAIELRVAGAVNLTHTADPDEGDDLVGAEPAAGDEGH